MDYKGVPIKTKDHVYIIEKKLAGSTKSNIYYVNEKGKQEKQYCLKEISLKGLSKKDCEELVKNTKEL